MKNKKVLSENDLKQIPITALFGAVGIVLPQFFHIVGLGATFLPMFLPVMLGSMLLSWRFAMSLAIICPLFSWFLTSMPPLVPPVLPIMILELIAISLVISIIRVHLHKPVWLALLSSIVIDRLILFFIVSFIAPQFGFTHPIFSIVLVLSGIPGIILQIIVIPLAIKLIEKKFPNLRIEETEIDN